LRVGRPFDPGGWTPFIAEVPMTRILNRPLARFLRNEEGVTAVECALMLALVVVICLVALAPTATSAEPAPSPTVTLEIEQG
jgi:Flp pilus assembly pilin Flp